MTTLLTHELASLLRPEPAVKAALTCRETLRVMFQHPEAKSIVICNAANEPQGLLVSERFFLEATGQMGTAPFYSEQVTKLMNPSPLVLDINVPLEAALAEIRQRSASAKNDCIIITQDGKYAGVAYPSDLLRCLQ